MVSVADEYKDQVKSYVELMEDTIGILEAFLDVSDNGSDRIARENFLILVVFNNILQHRSRPSVIFYGESDVITSGPQGRQRFNILAETPTDFRGIGFC